MPQGVNQAIIAIWITIGLYVIGMLIDSWTGAISTGEFVVVIIISSLVLPLFPYKLGKGSNPARWVYSILFVASILLMLGGDIGSYMSKTAWIITIITLPIDVFIIFRLFQTEASEWFNAS